MTIRWSAFIARSTPSSAVTSAMIKKIVNSSDAAVRLALKIAWIPVMALPVITQAVRSVASIAGMTTFLRATVIPMMRRTPAR